MKKEIRQGVNDGQVNLLKEIMADQFILYTKSRNFHWNVTGPHFYGLHSAFEKIYDLLAVDIDDVAERIRVLGSFAPGTVKEFSELSSLKENPAIIPTDSEMLSEIINDIGILTRKSLLAAEKLQKNFTDEVTAGMLYSLVQKYEKTLWMLKSIINK